MLATVDGFITDAVITSANIGNRAAAWDLTSSYSKITMFANSILKEHLQSLFGSCKQGLKPSYWLINCVITSTNL